MSKNEDGGYVIKEAQIKRLEGVLLTHIEAVVPAGNQVAAKSLVSQAVWDLLEPSYIWIDGDQLNEKLVKQNPRRSFVKKP
jgi:hypothetical protein